MRLDTDNCPELDWFRALTTQPNVTLNYLLLKKEKSEFYPTVIALVRSSNYGIRKMLEK